jgi:prophage tail gpP-like protein
MKKKSNHSHTFTFLVEYDGGTYISQWQATTAKSAVEKWARSFDFSVIPRMKNSRLGGFRRRIIVESPTRITGTKGVWCTTEIFANKGMLINIVRTAIARS